MKELASLPLRLGAGIIFLAHGLQKAYGLFGGPGIVNFSKMIAAMRISPAIVFAYLAAYTELIGGIFLIIGFCTRLSAALLSLVMLVAIIGVHLSKGLFASQGGFEYPLVLLCVCISLLISGAGKYSITKKL